MVMIASAGLAVVQSASSTSLFDGGSPVAVAVAAAAALVVFYRVAVPLMRAAVHLLEFLTDIAIKIGVGLMALGALGFLVVIAYGAVAVASR